MSDKEDYESREATRTYYDHQNTHKSKGHTDRTSRSRRYTPQYETKPERHSARKEYRRIEDIPRKIGDKSDSDTEEDTPRENTKTEYFRRKYRRSRDSPDLHTGRREITREEQEILNEERRNRRSSDQHDNRRPKELTNIDAGRKTPKIYDFQSRRTRPKEPEDYDDGRRRPKDQDEYGRQWEPDDFDDRERRDKLEGLENIYVGRRSQRVFQATDPKRGGPTIWNEGRSPRYEQQDNFSRTFDLKHLEDFDPKMEDPRRRRKSKEPKEEEFDTGRTRTHEEVDRKSHLVTPKELKDVGRRRSPDYVNPQNFERRNPSTNQDHIKRTPGSSPQKLEYFDGRRTEQEEVFTSRGRPKSAKTREQTAILQAEETDPRRKLKDTERLRQLEDYNENKRSQDDFHRTSSSIRERAKELDLERSDQNKTDPRRRLNEQLKHFFAGKRTPREEDHREIISTRGKPKDSVEEKRREYQDDLHRRPKSTERTLLDDVDTEIASIIERRKEFVGGGSPRVNEQQEELLHRNTDSRPGKQLENLEKRSPRISVVEDDFGTLAISIRGSPKDLEEFIEGRRSPQQKENRSRDSRRSPRPSDAFDRETIYLREKRTKDYAGEKPTPRAIEPEEDLQRKTNRRTKFEQFQDFIVGNRSQRIDPEYDYDKETISIIERPKVFEEFLERRNPRPNDLQDVQKSDPRRERPKQVEDYDARRKDFYKEIRSPKDLEEFIERRKSPEPQDEFRRKDPSSRRRSSRQEDEFNKRTGSRERKSKEMEKLKIKEDFDDSRRTKSKEKDETEERRRTPGQQERVSRKSDSGRERQRKDSFEEEQTRQGTDVNRKDDSRRRRKSREDEEPEDFNEGRRNQIEQPEYFEEKYDSRRRRKSRENKEMEDFNKRRTSPEGFDQKVYSQKAMLRIGKDLDEFDRETR